MSQNDFNIANQGFPATRADLNSALQALASNSSGATEPATKYAYQWWYDTATDILKMRNGANDAWINIASFDQANGEWLIVTKTSLTGSAVLPSGTTAQRDVSPVAGYVRWNSTIPQLEVYDGSDWITFLTEAPASTPAGALFGLTLSNNTTDATNDIDIVAGSAASDDTTPVFLTLASAITKRLDAAWAVGTGNGGLDTGSVADGTYHVWLIRRSDTGVVDVLFSASATTPTMPTNYDQKRRIGSILRASGAIRAFTQVGDKFFLTNTVFDVNVNAPGTTAVTRALSVPSGIVVDAIIRAGINNNSAATRAYVIISPLFAADETPSIENGNTPGALNGSGAFDPMVELQVTTNTSAQVRSRIGGIGDSNVTLRMRTVGWIDTRGRFA